eukprot:COSAG01_NODE_2977_length_6764_cov_17.259865_5_plen_348_part_00
MCRSVGPRLLAMQWRRFRVGSGEPDPDAALWREQVSETVSAGDFEWQALDDALLESVLKYLGCEGVPRVQCTAAAALRARLAAPAAATLYSHGGGAEHGGEEGGGEALALRAVREGGLHTLVGWLGSGEPPLRVAAVQTLRAIIAACASSSSSSPPPPPPSSLAAGETPPRHASSAAREVATLAAELGGAAVVRALATARSVAPTALLEDGTPQRGEITATFGPAGCDELWGLRLRQRRGGITAVLVSVAEGSVAAGGAPWLRHGLQLIGVDGWHPSAHGGSLLRALEAAAAAVGRRAREGRWRGGDSCRLLTLRFRDPRWLCEHLAREGEAHRQRRADANLFSACN